MQLTSQNQNQTMSSLDYLKDFINPAREAVGEAKMKPWQFTAKIKDEFDDDVVVKRIDHPFQPGQKMEVVDLTQDQCKQIAMRESKAVRKSVVAKLNELESKKAPQIPKTYAAALLEAGRLALELEQSQAVLAIAAPKAEVFDRVIERDTLLNATQVAQQVGMSAVKMNRILDDMGGIYNQAVKRHRTFCNSWVSAGHGEMKLGEQGYPQALFTPKGALRVVEMLTSEGVI